MNRHSEAIAFVQKKLCKHWIGPKDLGAEVLDDPLSQHKGRVVQLCRRKVLNPRGNGCFCRIARTAELGEMTVGFRFRKRIRLGKGIWRLTLARERLAQRRRQRARREHQ